MSKVVPHGAGTTFAFPGSGLLTLMHWPVCASTDNTKYKIKKREDVIKKNGDRINSRMIFPSKVFVLLK